MGQQQLLLLVLGAIIVGVAIVVGINIFSTSAVNANRDAVVQDCLTIATKAQQWWRTPTVLGGGQRDFTIASADLLSRLHFPGTNENGSYSINVTGADAITITGAGTEPGPSPNFLQVTLVVHGQTIENPTITIPGS
jgi:hypothetical protein